MLLAALWNAIIDKLIAVAVRSPTALPPLGRKAFLLFS